MGKSVFNGYGVEVRLREREDFLKVRETLTRIGEEIDDHTLQQTCYILHKKGKYAILHWRELECMDGNDDEVTIEDVLHRNKVAHLLDEWELVDLQDEGDVEERAGMGDVKIIAHRDKSGWNLVSSYAIGTRKK